MNKVEAKTLYLIPTPITEGIGQCLLPKDLDIVRQLQYFIVEKAKTARRHLKLFEIFSPISQVKMMELDTNRKFPLDFFLEFMLKGQRIGLMSEAGCPAIADPGAKIVRLAYQAGFKVIPMVGPSSLLLALMASGGNGQRFTFHGYLPIAEPQRSKYLTSMVRNLYQYHETQIFIETPYRNQKIFEFLLQTVPTDLRLNLAINLTHPTLEVICSHLVHEWRQHKDLWPALHKYPCVFTLSLNE
ncbi:MAG: SAM-dependent methyltransferase [Neisseriaceae bacterium]